VPESASREHGQQVVSWSFERTDHEFASGKKRELAGKRLDHPPVYRLVDSDLAFMPSGYGPERQKKKSAAALQRLSAGSWAHRICNRPHKQKNFIAQTERAGNTTATRPRNVGILFDSLTWITSKRHHDKEGMQNRRFRAETCGRCVYCSLTRDRLSSARVGGEVRHSAARLPGHTALQHARAIGAPDHCVPTSYPDLATTRFFREFRVAASTRSGY